MAELGGEKEVSAFALREHSYHSNISLIHGGRA